MVRDCLLYTSETIDYDALLDLAKEHKPKMIVAGASAYPRIIDFPRIRRIADEVGALVMVDMAHIAGLVATGLHPSPVPYAEFVTTTTHKTLRGPRGGLILCQEQFAKKIDQAIFPGTQGGPLMHVIAGKAVAFKEAASPEFKAYQAQVVKNAKVFAAALRIKRNRVLVYSNCAAIKKPLSLESGQSVLPDAYQHQVVVGAS